MDVIVNLRQEKNLHEEEIRLLKTTCARLKKQLFAAQEKEAIDGGGTRADWLRQQHQPETSNGAGL